jgi:ABC-type nitrate/sulfonate/bicarbonate transport system permease component
VPFFALRACVVCALLACWEGAARSGLVDPALFPPLTAVLRAVAADLAAGELGRQAAVTLRTYGQGLALALILGIGLGTLVGALPRLRAATGVLLEFLRPIPSVAVIPIAILLLGIDVRMRTVVVCYAALWPVLLNTMYGIYDVDPAYVETARLFGRRRGEILRAVLLPAALPYVMTGARLASATALILAVTSEMVVGNAGLGAYVRDAEMSLRVDALYGGILVAGGLGVALNALFVAAGGRLLRWHRGFTGKPAGA